MTDTAPTTPERRDPATPAPDAAAVTPATKALLRRRFLAGGAAAVPLIVTFGRPAHAVVSVDCFVKAGFLSPSEAFYDTTNRDTFLASLRQNTVSGNADEFLANLEASGFACAVSVDIDLSTIQQV